MRDTAAVFTCLSLIFRSFTGALPLDIGTEAHIDAPVNATLFERASASSHACPNGGTYRKLRDDFHTFDTRTWMQASGSQAMSFGKNGLAMKLAQSLVSLLYRLYLRFAEALAARIRWRGHGIKGKVGLPPLLILLLD